MVLLYSSGRNMEQYPSTRPRNFSASSIQFTIENIILYINMYLMKRVKLCFQGRETALPGPSQFTIITVSSLERGAFGQLCHNKSKC